MKTKNKRVPKTVKEKLLKAQKGKCAGCGRSFERMGVSPMTHHVGKGTRLKDLQLLCPNCHSTAHEWNYKKDKNGNKRMVLSNKRVKKKRKKRKKKEIKSTFKADRPKWLRG